MKAKDLFKVRPLDCEEKEFIVTIGNHLATEEKFKTAKDAQKYINGKNWDLIMSMIFACIEAREIEKDSKQTKEEETK